jgi:hypothetical protein
MLQAAKYNIILTPAWVPGWENKLADAISRFDNNTIANWCPHWQAPYTSLLLQETDYSIQEITCLL